MCLRTKSYTISPFANIEHEWKVYYIAKYYNKITSYISFDNSIHELQFNHRLNLSVIIRFDHNLNFTWGLFPCINSNSTIDLFYQLIIRVDHNWNLARGSFPCSSNNLIIDLWYQLIMWFDYNFNFLSIIFIVLAWTWDGSIFHSRVLFRGVNSKLHVCFIAFVFILWYSKRLISRSRITTLREINGLFVVCVNRHLR